MASTPSRPSRPSPPPSLPEAPARSSTKEDASDRARRTARIEAIRAFNRFWTARIGALGPRHLDTPFSLTEARVVFELTRGDATEVGALRGATGLDAGYLSRTLAALKRRGLLLARAAEHDRRRQVVRLSARGRVAAAQLDRLATRQVASALAAIDDEAQRRAVEAMATIRAAFGDPRAPPPAVILRAPAPGEYGWMVARHGALYAAEQGWDESFEGLVATIVGGYLAGHDLRREAAWIAEVGGEPAGCVLCVRRSERVAQLRLLLVEPRCRGLGIGSQLVDACVRFARHAGYHKLVLWTRDVLHAARRVYERAGFALEAEEQAPAHGQDLVDQTWSLDLQARPPAPPP